MNLINSNKAVHKILSVFAPLVKPFPAIVLKSRFFLKSGKWANWERPDNIQDYFLKVYKQACAKPDSLRFYSDLTDKIAVRKFVQERIGSQYLTKLYGTWERPEDIDFSALPVPCVIKTNNGCGTNIIIKTKEDVAGQAVGKRLADWLSYPYGALTGQPHYSGIKPAVLAEEYLEQCSGDNSLPNDYKFFCFNGEPRFVLCYTGRKLNSHKMLNQVYDLDWNLVDGVVNMPSDENIPKPEAFEEMKELVRKLARGFDAVRVDFYSIGGRPVFGEMTFTPDMVTNFKMSFLEESMKYV